MQTLRAILLILVMFAFTLAVVALSAQNSDPVQVTFLNWEKKYPLFLLLFVGFSAGALFTAIAALVEIVYLRLRMRKSKRTSLLLQKEVDALRNQPLYDQAPPSSSVQPEQFENQIGEPEEEEGGETEVSFPQKGYL